MIQRSFYFIRHGETDWNRESRLMGQKNIPLNDKGRLQAKQAAFLLRNCNIKTICHSPLQRARETAVILNELLNCSLQEIDSLKECNWGSLEGKLKENREYLDHWIAGATSAGAESCQMFKERALEGINLSLTYPSPLIVAHGGIYWVLQQILCQDKLPSNAQNCFPFLFSELDKNEWISMPLEQSFGEDNYDSL